MRNVMLLFMVNGASRVFRIVHHTDRPVDRRIMEFALMAIELDEALNAKVLKDRFAFLSPDMHTIHTEDDVFNWITAMKGSSHG